MRRDLGHISVRRSVSVAEQKITITIDEQGALTAKTGGFKGEACLEALEELLDLDADVISVKTTDEYRQREVSRRQTTLSQGRR